MKELDGRLATILLVEDDRGDQELTKRALEEGKIDNKLIIVNDGEEALDYLLRRGEYEDPLKSPRPDLILLDLNMPKVDGKQVLKEIQKYDELKRLNIVVLTTSTRDEDVVRSYDLGVKSFITKPVDMEQFRHVIQSLKEYWFHIVVLPKNEE